MNDRKKKIRIVDNGPYLVSEEIPLFQDKIIADEDGASADWEKGKEYDGKAQADEGVYALCRCGHSGNMPFCTGEHRKNGFCNNEVAARKNYDDSVYIYEGEAIDLMDQVELCAVARFCERYNDVWHMTMGSGPEHPDYEAKAIDEANKCPAGRLTVRKDGHKIEPDLHIGIGVVEDVPADKKGPLWAKGGITIVGADNCEYEVRNRVTLCRCGESSNMPFCDASHMNCPHMEGLDEE